jgi:pyridoxamine 5'-phosphate oxidase
MSDISQIRNDYKKFRLDEDSIFKNPFYQFNKWMEEALAGEFYEPTAFVLSTVSIENKPSSRALLLKGYDDKGFVFYSNYESRKGHDLSLNPNAAMIFFWDKFERQIRIEGRVEKTSKEESEKYFNSRPYKSRIGAWASKQSQTLKSRFKLLREASFIMLKHPLHVPLPENWGGYRLIPEYFEFWQGRESRLHDRFSFKLNEGNWVINRLYP